MEPNVRNFDRAIVEQRSQKSAGSGHNKFGGPDRYVAVQIVPAGVEPLTALDTRIAAKRGITIKHFGEGYYNSRGPRSAFGKALAKAQAFADAFNSTRVGDAR